MLGALLHPGWSLPQRTPKAVGIAGVTHERALGVQGPGGLPCSVTLSGLPYHQGPSVQAAIPSSEVLRQT